MELRDIHLKMIVIVLGLSSDPGVPEAVTVFTVNCVSSSFSWASFVDNSKHVPHINCNPP